MTNSEFLEIIKTNINNKDYHLTLVNGGQNPEYSYSIGLTEKFGFELIIAGGFISIKTTNQYLDMCISNCNLDQL